MPKVPTELLFTEEREWTNRKHEILRRIAVPTAEKMKLLGPRMVFVDGYAGANRYQGEIRGSTVIFVEAARRVQRQGKTAVVHACEPSSTFAQSTRSALHDAVHDQTLIIHESTHERSLPEIIADAGKDPALVFLNPQAASELSFKEDIAPWIGRDKTDLLGVFHSTQCARICAAALEPNSPKATKERAERIAGENWREADSEDRACELFLALLSSTGKLVGLYKLRKRDSNQLAYAFFGVSGSKHGLKLLSDAIARDFGLLHKHDAESGTPSLFSESDEEQHLAALEAAIERLVFSHPTANGQTIMEEAHGDPEVIPAVFGAYKEKEYTLATKRIRAGQKG